MSATGKGEKSEQTRPISPLPYTIEMTATAEGVYADLYRKCKTAEKLGHSESVHCTTFHMVQEAVKTIIPHDPLNKRHALRGHLSNIFRLRKGRLRIIWIASSTMRRICILFISETLRKDGDPNDPYEVFQGQLEAGFFDQALQRLGVKRTGVKRK
ncbi:MAG: type II toxin-antitoxin system YhaV family toxin [Terracidiphilus sp.]